MCQCFQPHRRERVMSTQCGHPPPDITTSFTAGGRPQPRHRRAQEPTALQARCKSKVCKVNLLPLDGAEFPGPLQPLFSQIFQKQGGKIEKLTPSPFSHRFPLQVKALRRTSMRLQASRRILSTFFDSIQY